ncbi:MAG: septation regulator SpoVG [Candidatus Eisenbacteria bacterium]|nr:septation regulator SpoVG [Candidatus Latescibacterota bacterium]MBD3301535.1 septation regulator SpoVG [Candidatus Eisenbacteria bacterium]
MNITEVRIHLREDAKLRAFASMTIDDCFVIQGMKLIQGSRGLFVAMPNRRRPDGTFQDICHPLDQKTRDQIEEVIFEEYRRTLDPDSQDPIRPRRRPQPDEHRIAAALKPAR